MLKHKPDIRNIRLSILILLTIFILVGSVGSTDGSASVAYFASDYNILNGTYLSGGVPTSIQAVDSDYLIVRSFPSSTSTLAFNPSGYNLFGNTAYVSGTMGDLVSDNGVYLTFRSYAQSSTLTEKRQSSGEQPIIFSNSVVRIPLEQRFPQMQEPQLEGN